MKKLFIIISIILTVNCSSLISCGNNNNKTINKGDHSETITDNNKSIEAIKKETDSAISKADTLSLKNKIVNKEKEIKKIFVLCVIALIISIIGIIFSIINMSNINKTIIPKIKDIKNKVSGLDNQNLFQPKKKKITSEDEIKQIINKIKSDKTFQDFIEKEIGKYNPNICSKSENSENIPLVEKQINVVLYASNSTTSRLSDIQNEYQKGRSIYKLILSDSQSDTANVDLCSQEDALERILKNDHQQIIGSICNFTEDSRSPNKVNVKEKGIAKKTGEEWEVIKKLIIEFK